MGSEKEQCLSCGRTSDEVPLVYIRHRGETLWICPQHFPILIHNPMQLVDKLPGVKNLTVIENH
jgi:hypothetical protein